MAGNLLHLGIVSPKKASKATRFRWFFANAMVALWLFTGFAAASADLHHCVHDDSQSAEHDCFITKYTDGQFLNAPAAQVQILAPSGFFDFSQCAASNWSSAHLSLLPPGRAPPVF
jgi:hypothetical protein